MKAAAAQLDVSPIPMALKRRFLAPSTIRILVDIDEIVLDSGDARIALEPTLHVSGLDEAHNGIRLIAALSTDRPERPDRVRIRLFHPDELPADVLARKSEYLTRLFRFALQQVVVQYWFPVKPRIELTVAAAVSRVTAGYAVGVLRRCLLESGAKEVELVESSHAASRGRTG